MTDKSPADRKIAKAFFIDFKTISDVSRELYGKKRVGFVSDHFKKWNNHGYFDEKHVTIDKTSNKGKTFTQSFTGFRLNLKPYFEYIKEKANVSFNKVEREILEFIFSYKIVREIICRHSDLFEGTTIFLERTFLYKTDLDWPHGVNQFFRKAYFVKNKKLIKIDLDMYTDKMKMIDDFEKTSNNIFNRIRDKIKVISSFTEQDYFDLTTETDLRKYQYMPKLSEIKNSKSKEEKLKMINIWSLIYFNDEIPEGW